jgi:hypothetical protein
MMRKFHWKNIIFLFMLTFSSLTLKAQTLNFEETVKYIKDKIECCSSSGGLVLESITETGRITFSQGYVFDIFDWVKIDNDLNYLEQNTYENGTRVLSVDDNQLIVYKWTTVYGSQYFRIETYVLTFKTPSDAEKVCNAFKHLKTLCTPEADPFGN